MVQRVIHLDVHRTAFILALCGAIVSVFFMVPMAMYLLFSLPQNGFGASFMGSGMAFVLMPVFYFAVSYIFSALAVIVFNFVAPRIGGIGMTVVVEVGAG